MEYNAEIFILRVVQESQLLSDDQIALVPSATFIELCRVPDSFLPFFETIRSLRLSFDNIGRTIEILSPTPLSDFCSTHKHSNNFLCRMFIMIDNLLEMSRAYHRTRETTK